MSKDEKHLITAYFNAWQNYINDLILIHDSNEITLGKEAALTLGFCYIEALGKLMLYDATKKCPSSSSIFIKTLQVFDISKKCAEKIYINFRCDFVHSGPTSKTSSIKNKHGDIVEIDVVWCICILTRLLSIVRNKHEDLPFIEIAKAIGWDHP